MPIPATTGTQASVFRTLRSSAVPGMPSRAAWTRPNVIMAINSRPTAYTAPPAVTMGASTRPVPGSDSQGAAQGGQEEHEGHCGQRHQEDGRRLGPAMGGVGDVDRGAAVFFRRTAAGQGVAGDEQHAEDDAQPSNALGRVGNAMS